MITRVIGGSGHRGETLKDPPLNYREGPVGQLSNSPPYQNRAGRDTHLFLSGPAVLPTLERKDYTWANDSFSQAARFLGLRAFCVDDDRRAVSLVSGGGHR